MSDRIRSLWIVETSDDGENWQPMSEGGSADTPVYAFRRSEDASALAGPGVWPSGIKRRVTKFVLPGGDCR